MNDLLDRFHERCNAGVKNNDRDDHRAQVLDPSITEGMLFVRLPSRKPGPDYGDQGTARIGNVVDCIQHDGDRMGQDADHCLKSGKEYIGDDPDYTGPDDHRLPAAFSPAIIIPYFLFFHHTFSDNLICTA